jgi:nucleotide-binding universal stress UspA family protein
VSAIPGMRHDEIIQQEVLVIVVAGVDESALAGRVLARAMQQATWRGAELHVVSVFQLPIEYLEARMDPVAVTDAYQRSVFQPLEPSMAEAEVEVERVELEGYPPDTLVAYANDVGADLVVVGTRGRGELASLVLGSTSHRALHLAGCDVLVVKPATG